MAIILSPSNLNQSIINQETTNLSFADGVIKIVDKSIIFSSNLQKELDAEIVKAQDYLKDLSARLSVEYSNKFGINYIHQGQDKWLLQFTFGGLNLNINQTIILSTEQIFTLKEYFEKMPSITIKQREYQTTGWMKQVGPILHDISKGGTEE